MSSTIICSQPECQTTAGCQCGSKTELAADRINAAASRSMAEMLIEIERLRGLLILAFDQLAKRASDESDQEILRKIAPEVRRQEASG